MGPEQGERGYRVETKMFLLGKEQCCDYLDRILGKESCDNEYERQDHSSTGRASRDRQVPRACWSLLSSGAREILSQNS